MSNPYDSPTGWAAPSAFRYEFRNGKGRYPIPDPDWQRREYIALMGKEPMGVLDEPCPQFQYNPRTKAGKALLSDLVASEGAS